MFLPENIDLSCSEKYILSIRLLPNGFSFCIHAPHDADVFFYKETTFSNRLSYAESLKKMVFDLGFLSQVFLKTQVISVSERYTLVPNEMFESAKSKEIFDYNFVGRKGEKVLHNALDTQSATLLFGISEEIYGFLMRSLWNPVFGHSVSWLIPALSAHGEKSDNRRCYVDFQDSLVGVCFFQAEQLLSANTYSINDADDALYYILSVCEKQNFDQSADFLYYSGNLGSYKAITDTLKKLIKNVRVLELSSKNGTVHDDLPTDLKVILCG